MTSRVFAPWHLWVVGLLMLVWNALSCYSYVMTLTQNAAYFRGTGVTPQIAAYFAAVPAWYVVAWTIAVWGGLVASVGLLMRRSWTVRWFVASQLAMAVNSVWTLVNPDARVLGRVGSISAVVLIILGAFLVLYSTAMKRRGVLRTMAIIVFLLSSTFVAGTAAQTAAPAPHPLPMAEVHACSIQFTNTSAVQGRWGGQIAEYDARADSQGAVVTLKRRIVEGREHLPPLVRLDQFERCLRGWRFEKQADYTVSLLGGTIYEGEWVIEVRRGDRQFRVRMPVMKSAG